MQNFLKNNKFFLILLGSIILGGVVGSIWGEGAKALLPLANIFLNLLFCLVVPIIFVSLVSSIAKMEDLRKLGKILLAAFIVFAVTQVVASIFMGFVTGIFNVSKNANLQFDQPIENVTGGGDILSMFTVSDFTLLWSRKNLMALIVFSILSGVATVAVGEKNKPVVALLDQLLAIIMKMVSYVMYLAPLCLGSFFAALIGEQGSQFVGALTRVMLTYLIATVVWYFAFNSLFAFIGGGFLGVRRFWANIAPVTLTALATCSSAACIPLNLIASKKMGIPDRVADLIVPLGTNLHKDGACQSTILRMAFICPLFGMNFLNPKIFFTAVFVAVIASTVMGAIPSGGHVAELFIVSMFGFPQATIPIMVLIGTFSDFTATAINASGQPVAAMMVARFTEGKDWINHTVPNVK